MDTTPTSLPHHSFYYHPEHFQTTPSFHVIALHVFSYACMLSNGLENFLSLFWLYCLWTICFWNNSITNAICFKILHSPFQECNFYMPTKYRTIVTNDWFYIKHILSQFHHFLLLWPFYSLQNESFTKLFGISSVNTQYSYLQFSSATQRPNHFPSPIIQYLLPTARQPTQILTWWVRDVSWWVTFNTAQYTITKIWQEVRMWLGCNTATPQVTFQALAELRIWHAVLYSLLAQLRIGPHSPPWWLFKAISYMYT